MIRQTKLWFVAAWSLLFLLASAAGWMVWAALNTDNPWKTAGLILCFLWLVALWTATLKVLLEALR